MRALPVCIVAAAILLGVVPAGTADELSLSVASGAGANYYRTSEYLSVHVHVPNPPPAWLEISARGAMTTRVEEPAAGDLDVPILLGDGPPVGLTARASDGKRAELGGVWEEHASRDSSKIGAWAVTDCPHTDFGTMAEAVGGWNPASPVGTRRNVALMGGCSSLVLASMSLLGRRLRAIGAVSGAAGLLLISVALFGMPAGAIIERFRIVVADPHGGMDSWILAASRHEQIMEIACPALPRPMLPGTATLVLKPHSLNAGDQIVIRVSLADGQRWACVFRAWPIGSIGWQKPNDPVVRRIAAAVYPPGTWAALSGW